MTNLTQLRIAAREIFDETLRAVDPLAALRAVASLNGSTLRIGKISIDVGNRKIYSIAVGKAARRMAAEIDQLLGDKFSGGVITSNDSGFTATRLSSRWVAFLGGHPEPDESSLAAARASFQLLQRANEERALVIFLVSGGGSAMIEWPVNETISLDDLKAVNRLLVSCGASISEINSVRRAFSAVKGGKLAARAPDCDQITLIVSDVPEGEERNVASGPTVTPPSDAPDPREVIDRYNLRMRLPMAIVQAIENAQPLNSTADATREHLVLLSNSDALQAAAKVARQRGFITETVSDIGDQPIEKGCDLLIKRLESLRAKRANAPRNRLEAGLVPPLGTSADSKQNASVVCLISGGEFACPVQGSGIGGRNLESALRLSRSISFGTVTLCAGTDGIDGNSPAAGAIVDSTTIDRATAIGLDVEDFLRGSDSYSFFVALGDVIATGPTGTNVRDLRILLAADCEQKYL
jgi:hydroxypyruvate reductase